MPTKVSLRRPFKFDKKIIKKIHANQWGIFMENIKKYIIVLSLLLLSIKPASIVAMNEAEKTKESNLIEKLFNAIKTTTNKTNKRNNNVIVQRIKALSQPINTLYNKHGWTLLYAATQADNFDAVELLIKHGALIDQPNKTDKIKTPLLCALATGNNAIGEYLLQNNAKLTIPNAYLIADAALQGKSEHLIQLLIHKGLDIRQLTCTQIVKLNRIDLIKHIDLCLTPYIINTHDLLNTALTAGNTDGLCYLIQKGGNIKKMNIPQSLLAGIRNKNSFQEQKAYLENTFVCLIDQGIARYQDLIDFIDILKEREYDDEILEFVGQAIENIFLQRKNNIQCLQSNIQMCCTKKACECEQKESELKSLAAAVAYDNDSDNDDTLSSNSHAYFEAKNIAYMGTLELLAATLPGENYTAEEREAFMPMLLEQTDAAQEVVAFAPQLPEENYTPE